MCHAISVKPEGNGDRQMNRPITSHTYGGVWCNNTFSTAVIRIHCNLESRMVGHYVHNMNQIYKKVSQNNYK